MDRYREAAPEFNLRTPERRKPHEKLQALLSEISVALNKEAEEKHSIKNLLDAQCQVDMAGFAKDQGGIYDQALLDESAAENHKRELDFSAANVQSAQEFYRTQHGVEGTENIIAAWKANKAKDKNGQMEMAVTALLHKVLGSRYFVARTADYDDYHNGSDNIIIDKETGVVICAFDEVHEGGKGQRTKEKQEKVAKVAKQGGAKLRFGLKFENGSLQRSQLDNLPVFYLGLSSDELVELTGKMNYTLVGEPSDEEKRIFAKLMDSIQSQYDLLAAEKLPSKVKVNLNSFRVSLDEIKAKRRYVPRNLEN